MICRTTGTVFTCNAFSISLQNSSIRPVWQRSVNTIGRLITAFAFDCRAYGHLGQTFRGSHGPRDRKADEPSGSDSNTSASEANNAIAMDGMDNAIPSHGGGTWLVQPLCIFPPNLSITVRASTFDANWLSMERYAPLK